MINDNGYEIDDDTGALKHKVVWEAVYGPVPAGFDVHHIGGRDSKLDNRIENLVALPHAVHFRLHDAARTGKPLPGRDELLPLYFRYEALVAQILDEQAHLQARIESLQTVLDNLIVYNPPPRPPRII